MKITVDIPETLVNELCAWFRPRDTFAPTEGKVTPGSKLGPIYDLKTYVDRVPFKAA